MSRTVVVEAHTQRVSHGGTDIYIYVVIVCDVLCFVCMEGGVWGRSLLFVLAWMGSVWKAQREQYLPVVGLGYYKWYQSQILSDLLIPHEAVCQQGR